MKLIIDENLSVGWLTGKFYSPSLTSSFFIKGTFKLIPDSIAIPDGDNSEFVNGNVHFNENEENSLFYPSDFVPYKPRADVLFVGDCHIPEGKKAQACQVSLKVGSLSKTLNVFGKRYWDNNSLGNSIPEPNYFSSIPLRYENSFGGKGFSRNPIGKGNYRITKKDIILKHSIPNILHTDEHVTSLKKISTPAGFGPINQEWPQRQTKVGNYDEKWLKKRWPWFPEDFDWGFFNSAPHDQQITGYLKGDETLEFNNLHPTYSTYKSKLPCLRARCFISEQSPENKEENIFREIPLYLDTLWIDMNNEKLILVWRGNIEVQTMKLKEIDCLLALLEPLDEPDHHIDFYLSYLNSYLKKEKKEGTIEIDHEALKQDQTAFEKTFADMDENFKNINKEFSELEQQAINAEADQKDDLIAQGIDSAIFQTQGIPQSAEKIQREYLAGRKILFKNNSEQAAHTKEADFSFMNEIAQMDNNMEKMSLSSKESTPMSREIVEAAAINQTSLAGKDLSKLDLSKIDLSGMNLSNAILSKTNLSAANLMNAQLTNAVLSGTDLSNVNMTGAILDSADCSKAIFTGAKMRNISLTDTILSNLELEKIDFSGASGTGTDFSESNLTESCFSEANLPQADFCESNLKKADFQHAKLQAAQFEGVNAPEINMKYADITGLHASDGSIFTNGRFCNSTATESIWSNSRLEGTDFSGSLLERSDFSEALLDSAIFDRTDLRSAVFDDASLTSIQLTNANLLRVSFERADLTTADLRNSNAYEAGFFEAKLDNILLAGTNLKNTLLK